jgi:hypothetical protein
VSVCMKIHGTFHAGERTKLGRGRNGRLPYTGLMSCFFVHDIKNTACLVQGFVRFWYPLLVDFPILQPCEERQTARFPFIEDFDIQVGLESSTGLVCVYGVPQKNYKMVDLAL